MARSHLLHTYVGCFGVPRWSGATSGPSSGGIAHLRSMRTETTRTAPAADEQVVLTGAFEVALSLSELAAVLHVPAQTIYDLRSQGRGPRGFRVGRQLRFRKSEIEAWLVRLEEEDAERHRASDRR